jgi:hypothetical protein
MEEIKHLNQIFVFMHANLFHFNTYSYHPKFVRM